MELQTLQYNLVNGWSVKNFPDLDSEQTLILLFAAPQFIDNPAPIKELKQHYPKSKMIGCSSAGEIYGPSIHDGSISVAIMRFEHGTVRIVKKIAANGDSLAAGEYIAKELNNDQLRGIFVLSEGLGINGSELVKGLNTIETKQVVITGGLAGDGERFQKTWSVFDGEICTGTVVAAGFYGESIQIGHASRGGWDIFGPERVITRATNNVLYELDNQPALALYKEYLGERAAGLPATGLLFPLAIRKDEKDTKQLVRTILGVDEAAQSLIFAGDMPMGYRAQLMRANFDRLIESAGEAGETARSVFQENQASNGAALTVAISCVGRRLLLGERTEEETEAVLESMPAGTKQIGFYSYGELSPYAVGNCDLHNQTMTITTLSES